MSHLTQGEREGEVVVMFRQLFVETIEHRRPERVRKLIGCSP
jgi:hypothetical protein